MTTEEIKAHPKFKSYCDYMDGMSIGYEELPDGAYMAATQEAVQHFENGLFWGDDEGYDAWLAWIETRSEPA